MIAAVAVLALIGLALGLFFGITQTNNESDSATNGNSSNTDDQGTDNDQGEDQLIPGLNGVYIQIPYFFVLRAFTDSYSKH